MIKNDMQTGTLSIREEDEICERTLRRLQEHAQVMGISIEKALEDVIPETRKRLIAYMRRRGEIHSSQDFESPRCPECGGDGYFEEVAQGPFGVWEMQRFKCRACDGSGAV